MNMSMLKCVTLAEVVWSKSSAILFDYFSESSSVRDCTNKMTWMLDLISYQWYVLNTPMIGDALD